MISEIIPVNHKDRVPRVNALYKHIKENEGDLVEVIVACDNPAIYDMIQCDLLVRIPKRIEFTRSVNIAERFATRDLIGYIDDSVTLPKKWAKEAAKLFYHAFPTGMGAMAFEGSHCIQECWSRGLTTRRYTYRQNMHNFLWPEYLHSGDYELAQRALLKGEYLVSNIEFAETKIDDDSWKKNKKIFDFDRAIETHRRAINYRMEWWDEWEKRLTDYCIEDVDLEELKRNIYNV